MLSFSRDRRLPRGLERLGREVVVLDEGEHLRREVGLGVKDAVLDQPAVQDREEDLDLVEPGF